MTMQTAAERQLLDWLGQVIAGRDASLDLLDDGLEQLVVRTRLDALAARSAGGARLQEAARRAFAQSSHIERASTECLGHLRDAGVEAVTLKGPALAVRFWGDAALRQSTDVDLLIAPAELAPAIRALEAGGYRLGGVLFPGWYEARWHYHRTFNRAKPPTPPIELHWAVARSGLTRIDTRAIVAGHENVRCLHGELPAPAPHWQLVLAALHAVRHHFPLRELVDVAFVARALDERGLALAVREAQRAGVGPALYYSLRMSALRFGGEMPSGVAVLRPRGARDAIVRRYLAGLPVTGGVAKATMRLGKVVTPLTTSSLSRLPASFAWSLSDHPYLADRLDRTLRRRVSGAGGA